MATHAQAMTVGALLNTSSPVRVMVPLLQRPYSWDTPEFAELWSDLTDFNDKNPGDGLAGKEYFLGSVVAHHIEGVDARYEILDGQQRLATLTIILATLRDLLREMGCEEDAYDIQMAHVCKKQSGGKLYRFVLTLNEVDRVFFRDTIQKVNAVDLVPATASQKLIQKAKGFFRAALPNYAMKNNVPTAETYQRMQSVICDNLRVVLIESTEMDYVTDVFERLNDRGKGLSTLDLLRTLLISRAGASGSVEEVDAAWSSIYEISTSPATVESFLRHAWITRKGDVKSRSLYKEIKAAVTAKAAPSHLSDAVEFSNDLSNDAEIYKRIVNADHEDLDCARWLRAISTMGASSLLPCALSAVATLVKPQDQARILRSLVTVYVRFNVIENRESTTLEGKVFNAARNLRSTGDVEETLKILRGLLGSDSEFQSAFRTASVTRSGYQRHILEEIENYLSTKSIGDTSGPEKTLGGSGVLWIEHVYPQKPEKTWGRWSNHDEVLNRIGNLTLIHKKLNSTMKNRVFEKKKADYLSSDLKLNEYFARKSAWNEPDIDKRQLALAKHAPLVWPRF